MGNSPFLTIGIASYNYSRYLEYAFSKIKAQGFRDYEILYCDDGSTDDSVAVIQRLMRENPGMNIRLVTGENGGILANKNRIVDNARGKYLMICDADDYMLDGCLQALCEVAKQEDTDCVIGGFDEVDGNGKLLKRHVPPENASKWLYTWHHAQLYRLQTVRENHVRFTDVPDDVFYLQKVHLHCTNTCFVHASHYAWVRHEDSTSTAAHGEWNPVALWQKLSGFIAELRSALPEKDRHDLNYYLYKWYYFNVCDLPVDAKGQLHTDLQAMQQQMQKAMPGYLQWHRLRAALSAPDTQFAKTAVFGCWLVEKCGLATLPPRLRSWQKKMRERKAVNGTS